MSLTQVATFLVQRDELETAKTLLKTFAKYAETLQQFDELGMLFDKAKAYHEAIEMLQKCEDFAINQEHRKAIYANYAKLYNNINDPVSSIKYADIILEMMPGDSSALLEKSFSYYLLGNSETSYQIQKSVLNTNLDPKIHEKIMYNMATFQMQRGQFKAGLKNLITIGRKIGIYPLIKSRFPRWTGDLSTKATIAVYAESGIGDEIINIRFMNYLKRRGLNAVWIDLRKDLCDMFRRNGFDAYENDNLLPAGDYVMCEAMSLPIFLELDQKDLWDGPYLKPDPAYVEKWKIILPEKFMTVRWSGNPYYDQDLHRSIDRNEMIPALQKYGMPLVSLQVDTQGIDDRVIDPKIESWEDTLAIQWLAFHNITSCTSTGHSASAMGVPCVVLPPIATYYTWLDLKPGNVSHWYGNTTRIFSQRKHKDWSESIDFACKCIEEKLNDEMRKNSSLHDIEE